MLYFSLMRTRWIAGAVVLALLVAFGVGLYTGVSERLQNIVSAAQFTIPGTTISLSGSIADSQPQDVDFSKFWQAWGILDQNFVETHASGTIPTYQERVYGAIAGLTDSYGDPYTVFFPPADAKQFNEDIAGAFGGVGMELGARDGSLTVIAPIKGSPAEAAGVRSGDVVVGVDDKATEKMPVDAAVKLIRGEVGTTVTVVLRRAGVSDPITAKIVRQTIQIPIINSYNRADKIFVIELYSFSANSADLFRGALRQFFESGDTKLILDLRGNPGGYLDAAVQMASYFLPVGDVVVTEDYKGKQPDDSSRSLGYNVFVNKKLSMAILVDQGSASASEILAGALSQHNVAKLVGTRTFGKGSVQQLMDLGGGAELKVTIARWLTPDGTSISDGGLQPDIKADRTAADVAAGKDPQISAAVAWLVTQ
jgi:carboxyl-terminal processing protease